MKRPKLPAHFKIIGLTGPSGAGKGEVARCFEARHLPVIDTDTVYHELLLPPSPCLTALVEAFGPNILTADGTLDRAALATLVFGKDDGAVRRHQRLNEITHRFVIERTVQLLQQYAKNGHIAAVIDAPLLVEAGLHDICDHVVAVLADRACRLTRLMTRDGKSEQALNARLDAQPSDDFYRAHADTVILNEGDVACLALDVDKVLRRMGVAL